MEDILINVKKCFLLSGFATCFPNINVAVLFLSFVREAAV